ncbi:hypothetical protein G6F61_009946 [Rhizopus arrhizus]|nr:hypothetical protein G6F61_009946 [Rhizopus arrhizus]
MYITGWLKDFKRRSIAVANCQPPKNCDISCELSCLAEERCSQLLIDNTYNSDNSSSNSSSPTNRVALIAGVTAGLVTIALSAILIVVFVRRNQGRKIERPLPAINVVPSSTSNLDNNSNQKPIDDNHPQLPFILGSCAPLIPRLEASGSPVFASHVIRRSLNLQPSSSLPMMANINRSSSVKLTKYDYHPGELRRAVSVKKNDPTVSHSSSVTRVDSTNSDKIVCAKPIIVRIIRSEEGNKKILKVPHESLESSLISSSSSIHTNTSGSIHFYFCPLAESQASIKTNKSSHSTLADGEITVIYDPSST